MTDALFNVEDFLVNPTTQPAANLSADRRRTLRQAAALESGRHPVAGSQLHPDAAPVADREAPGRRCGNCRFREVLGYRNRSYAKCMHPGSLGADDYDKYGPPRATHGAASDIRAWWPACTDHSYGEPSLSPDAARWVPEAVAP